MITINPQQRIEVTFQLVENFYFFVISTAGRNLPVAVRGELVGFEKKFNTNGSV